MKKQPTKKQLRVRTRQQIGKPIRATQDCPRGTEPFYRDGKFHSCMVVS